MKRILVICNTYYQLIVAIQIAETLWNKSEVDIVISDQSKGAFNVYFNLKKIDIFHKVYWRENTTLCQQGSHYLRTLVKMKKIILGCRDAEITAQHYDELVYYNPDTFTYGIYDRLKKKNRELVCSRYEEGILSYEDSEFLQNSRLNVCNIIRKKIGKPIMDENTKNFYCFYPEFYKGKLIPVTIPRIFDYRAIGAILQKLFNVDSEALIINEKYIFFTSVYDFEGGEPIGEAELVREVAEIVGVENLIIKTHPRDNRDIFKNSGLHIYKYSEIPWEAVQLNNDFSSKVLMTVNSGSVVGANMMMEKKAKALFLYKCCNYKVNQSAVGTSLMIDRFISEIGDENIKSVESLEELKRIVGK